LRRFFATSQFAIRRKLHHTKHLRRFATAQFGPPRINGISRSAGNRRHPNYSNFTKFPKIERTLWQAPLRA
jgi:hypothetical protein